MNSYERVVISDVGAEGVLQGGILCQAENTALKEPACSKVHQRLSTVSGSPHVSRDGRAVIIIILGVCDKRADEWNGVVIEL